MQQLPFVKMHGAENAYVFLDGFASALPQDPSQLAPKLCNRNAGIGADGIITMTPPSASDHDVEMQIWNADGSPAEMCGNGARCIAVWMKRKARTADICRIKTESRIVTARDICCNKSGGRATVEMGFPQPLSAATGDTIELGCGTLVTVYRVNLGNPHTVVFSKNLADVDVAKSGRSIEQHYAPVGGTNVEFVQQLNHNTFQTRVWERGSGETRSCGSGACAVAAAAVQAGRLPSGQPCVIRMPGGNLRTGPMSTGELCLTGSVKIVCTGRFDAPFNCD